MLALAAVGFFVQQSQSDSLIGFSTFNALHFEINYLDHGFVRRALVGTLFQAIPDAGRTGAIACFGWAVVVALALLVAWLLHALRTRLPQNEFRLMAVLWVAAPFTFLNFGYDFARLDQLNLLLLALSLYLVHRGRGVALALVSVVGLLIHEAYLFYGVAPVVAYAGSRDMATSRPGSAAVLMWPLVAAAATLAVVAAAGRYEPGRQALIQSLGSRLEDPHHNALSVWLRDGLDNPDYVMARLEQGLFSVPELLSMALLGLGMAALLVHVARANGCRLDLFALSPLAVLPLFGFGIDYARWLALIAILGLTVLTTRLIDSRYTGLGVARSRWVYAVLAVGVVAGPLGSVHLLPLWFG